VKVPDHRAQKAVVHFSIGNRGTAHTDGGDQTIQIDDELGLGTSTQHWIALERGRVAKFELPKVLANDFLNFFGRDSSGLRPRSRKNT
jgi:hypothetical protein